MFVTLINPPTLHRRLPAGSVDDARAHQRRVPYYDLLAAGDRRRLPNGRSSLPGEHLGLQSLAASLLSAGHEVEIVNGCLRRDAALAHTAARVDWRAADVVGLTGPADVFAEVGWLARSGRRAGFDGPIIFGNDLATLSPDRVLDACPDLDAVIRGEGEQSLCEFLEHIDGRRSNADLRSVTVRGEVRHRRAPSPATPLDLGQLPRPTRPSAGALEAVQMSPSVFTKRGCQYRCAFCTTGQWATATGHAGRHAWRFKDARAAAAELLQLSDDQPSRHVTIVDDLFVGRDPASRGWAADFADALIGAGSPATFMIDCRADAVERVLFELLRRAGLTRVFLGIESASDATLRALRKGYRSEATRRAIDILKELKIDVIVGFIHFTPEATLDDLEANRRFISELEHPDASLVLREVRVYPGTPLESQLQGIGMLRGAFPCYRSDYRDPRVARLAHHARQLAAVVSRRACLSRHDADASEVTAALYRLVDAEMRRWTLGCAGSASHESASTLDHRHSAVRSWE